MFVFHLGSTTFYCPSPCLIFRFKKMTTYQLNTYVQLDLHPILLWKLQIAFLTNFVARQSTFQCNTTQQGEETCGGERNVKIIPNQNAVSPLLTSCLLINMVCMQ